jgi:hypothetical protein
VQTGVGAATGLTDTAKAPFAGGSKVDSSSVQEPAGEETATKKGPRKIEIRNGQLVDVSGKDDQEDPAKALKE